ncbi:MAG: TrkA-like protein, partial [uncultured Nocardioides sp.]
ACRHRRSGRRGALHRPRAHRQRARRPADRQEPLGGEAGAGGQRRVAAGGLLRAVLPGGGPARPLRRGHRRHRRRQGQPGDLPARQDRVRRAPHRRAGEPPQQRVAVHRGVGRRRQRLDPAHHVGARRGGRHGRRPRPAVHLPSRQRQPGRDDVARGLAVRRQAHRAHPLPGELLAGDHPARRAGLHPRPAAAGRGGRRAALRGGGGRGERAREPALADPAL